MFRLLALLQLTRAALAFTAIADAWTILLLREPGSVAEPMGWVILRMLVLAVVSFGLYGFGMTLNDLLDARRDRIFAPRRPIPSGRIRPHWAVVTALGLLMAALLAAAFLPVLNLATSPEDGRHWGRSDLVPYSLLFAIATAALIVFYDATSKYLGGVGLVTLGAIRALHCLIGYPRTTLLFLSMILLTHVIIVSTIAYRLENKRPRLKWRDLIAVALGVLIGNGLALVYMAERGALVVANMTMLIGPAIAGIVYFLWAAGILLNRKLSPRQKGERLMLMGLFWLFVYDATMLASNGQYLASVAITLLLICAVLSFFGIRFLSRSMSLPKVGYRTDRNTLPVPLPPEPASHEAHPSRSPPSPGPAAL
jgi:4-hydroxybenzoate polyprenyltransferase